MARTDAIVLGAGIVGTSIALHLAKRGLCGRADRPRRAGRGDLLRQCRHHRRQHHLSGGVSVAIGATLVRIALKRSPEANYHLAFLPQVAPWLVAFRAASQPAAAGRDRAKLMRPLFARAVAEHEALAPKPGAERYLRRTGWLKLYRSDRAFAAQARELEIAARTRHRQCRARSRRGARARAVARRRFSATRCIGPAR